MLAGHWGNVDIWDNNCSDESIVREGTSPNTVSWGTMWHECFGHSAGLRRKTQATLPVHSWTGNPQQAAQQTSPLMRLKHVTSVQASESQLGKSDSKWRTAADKTFRQASRAVHWDKSFPLLFHFYMKLDFFLVVFACIYWTENG